MKRMYMFLLALAAAFLLLRGGEGPGFEEGDLLVCVNGDGSAELYWPKATAPSGMYRVEVTCGETSETRYCTQSALSLSGLPRRLRAGRSSGRSCSRRRRRRPRRSPVRWRTA